MGKLLDLERRVHQAVLRLADNMPLTDDQWREVGWLTLVDKKNLYFGPGNIRWAKTERERADNEKFYRALPERG